VSGFSESDPTQSGLALAYDSQLGESLLLKAGGHVSYAINTPFAIILPQVRANYARELKNEERALKVHFLADPTSGSSAGPVSSFLVFTDQPQRNFFEYAADLTLQFPFGISGYVEYLGVANDGFIHSHDLSLGLRIQGHLD
jgi:hypothetical protein